MDKTCSSPFQQDSLCYAVLPMLFDLLLGHPQPTSTVKHSFATHSTAYDLKSHCTSVLIGGIQSYYYTHFGDHRAPSAAFLRNGEAKPVHQTLPSPLFSQSFPFSLPLSI